MLNTYEMKTYFRILAFAKPYSKFVPYYIIFSTFHIIFSLANFSLIIPLLNVLFGLEAKTDYVAIAAPKFELTIDYVKSIFGYYFNQVIVSEGKVGALTFVCTILVISVLLSNLFRYLALISMTRLRTHVVKNVRKVVFENVIKLHVGFFNNERKGDLITRMSNDVMEVEHSVVGTLAALYNEPARIITIFVILLSMSFKLTIFSLILLPISGLIIAEITKRLKRQAHQSQHILGQILSIIDESISGIKIINGFNAIGFTIKRFNNQNDEYIRLYRSMYYKRDLASPLSEFMGTTVVAGILLYGGSLVLEGKGDLGPSEFITYIILFSQILAPAKALSTSFSNISKGLVSGERFFKLIDEPILIKDSPNAIEKAEFNESIKFENITFGYETEMVLKNISFTIPKGKTVALVGASGGGKSTIADLLPRFYDPQSGSIKMDNVSIKDITLESLRSHIGIVSQESILFNDTIFNNIAFGIPEVSLEQVQNAARVANAHDFISATENGYDTIIGERGSKLSGGQRQRISIARAILRNPEILILDEATSALDTESEKLVQDAITNLMKERTSLVIAHRLSTIQNADEILVLQKGEIIERGTHQELSMQNGFYSKLINMQNL